MTEKKFSTVVVSFKWAQISPDPHSVTMRNTLEPLDVIVQLEVPLTHEYIANSESVIKNELGVGEKERPIPILTKEGMQFAINALSLEDNSLEPVTDEDWDEGEEDAEWEDSIETDDEDIDWEDE